jgi:hypothetical protein
VPACVDPAERIRARKTATIWRMGSSSVKFGPSFQVRIFYCGLLEVQAVFQGGWGK